VVVSWGSWALLGALVAHEALVDDYLHDLRDLIAVLLRSIVKLDRHRAPQIVLERVPGNIRCDADPLRQIRTRVAEPSASWPKIPLFPKAVAVISDVSAGAKGDPHIDRALARFSQRNQREG
jgi:hypothetical protein